MDHLDNDGFFLRFVLLIDLFFDEFHPKKGPIQLR
jgi:hypothetical protein